MKFNMKARLITAVIRNCELHGSWRCIFDLNIVTLGLKVIAT